jgi:hypothetical protein
MEKTKYKQEETWVYYSPIEKKIYYFYQDKFLFSIKVNEEILRVFGSKYLIFDKDALISVFLAPKPEEIANKILSDPRFENRIIRKRDIMEMVR